MARKNWNALQIEYIKANARTGVSVVDWCKAKGLNFATAKRYIKKPETAFLALDDQKSTNKTANIEIVDNSNGCDKKCETSCESDPETAKQERNSQIKSQNARKHGGYARYFKDKSAFDVVVDFSLRDEVDLMRQRAISAIGSIEQFNQDLRNCTTAEDREITYKLLNSAQNALDRAVARIESLSRSDKDILLTLETIAFRKAQTKEMLLKADKLAQELSVKTNGSNSVQYVGAF